MGSSVMVPWSGNLRMEFCCKKEIESNNICIDSKYLLDEKTAATIIYIFKYHGGDVCWNGRSQGQRLIQAGQ